MSEYGPDDDPAESRRSFLRIAAATGLLAGTGGIGVARLTGETTASLTYQEQHEGYFSSYGDLLDSSYTSGSNVEPYALTNEADTGTRTVSDEGHNWTPEPTPTPEPTTTASCSGGIGSEGHCWTPTTAEPTPTPTSTPTSTPVPNDGPIATISTDPHVAVDVSTSFSGSSSYDPDGSISSYNWDFGDGSTASGESVAHTYTDTGSYTVSLTVADNDGASDSTSTTVTVGNQWQVNLDFDDGTTVKEVALEIGEDMWEVVSDGERFVHEVTQTAKDEVDDFLAGSLGDADAKFQYPTISSPIPIDMASGSTYTISRSQVDAGNSWVGGILPAWAEGNVPWFEKAYADWENGIVEAAAESTLGAAYGMAVTCAEFSPSLASTTSGYATVNYDWSTYLSTFFGSSQIVVSPFVRNATEGSEIIINDVDVTKGWFSLDLEGDFQVPTVWYDERTESFTFAMTDNSETDMRFKDGHEYQIGIRLILSTAAASKKGGVQSTGMAADQTTDHVNGSGDKGLRDSTPNLWGDGIENGVKINSIEIEW